MNIFNLKKNEMKLVFVVIILTISGFIFSCKDETNSPQGNKMRSLVVRASVQPDCNKPDVTPAQGVVVNGFQVRSANDTAKMFTMTTGFDGKVSFSGEFPIYGVSCFITASYGNQFRRTETFVWCEDRAVDIPYFSCSPPLTACCNNIPADTTVFGMITDALNNINLVQNTPAGVNRYTKCIDIMCNGCASGERIVFNVPAIPKPFLLESYAINGRESKNVPSQITLNQGECLTMCFAVSTADTGSFANQIDLGLVCNNAGLKHWRINLSAKVISPQCECIASSSTVTIQHGDEVQVGANQNYTDVILTNTNKECAIKIDSIRRFINGQPQPLSVQRPWSLVSTTPAIGTLIPIGETMSMSTRFSPQNTIDLTDSFLIYYSLQNGSRCSTLAIFKGNACRDMCPNVKYNGTDYSFNDISKIQISESVVFTQPSCINTNPEKSIELTFTLPDSACSAKTISFGLGKNEFNRYSINDANLSMGAGESRVYTIKFKIPTLLEFQNEKPNARTPQDSLYAAEILVNGCSINTKLNINITPSDAAKISGIRDLFGYCQHTFGLDNRETKPDYIVCYINQTSGNVLGFLKSLENPRGTGNAPKPDQISAAEGDFYVNVENLSDTVALLNARYNPCLFLVNNNIRYDKIKLWKANYSPTDFGIPSKVLGDLRAELKSGGYNLNGGSNSILASSRRIQMGDVYVIYGTSSTFFSNLVRLNVPCSIALLYVVRVDDGTNNAERRCGISFRLISPVYL